MEAPASHHETLRPEMKYSLRLSPPRFVKAKPIAVERRKYPATIAQSIAVSAIAVGLGGGQARRLRFELSARVPTYKDAREYHLVPDNKTNLPDNDG